MESPVEIAVRLHHGQWSQRHDVHRRYIQSLTTSLAAYRNGLMAGFTKRYGRKILVWYEYFERIDDAIARQKQVKAGSRKDKLKLIETFNPQWRDLYEELA